MFQSGLESTPDEKTASAAQQFRRRRFVARPAER